MKTTIGEWVGMWVVVDRGGWWSRMATGVGQVLILRFNNYESWFFLENMKVYMHFHSQVDSEKDSNSEGSLNYSLTH